MKVPIFDQDLPTEVKVSGGSNEVSFTFVPEGTDLVARGLNAFAEALNRSKVRFKKLSPEAIVPTRKTSESAGFDLHSLVDMYIPPGEIRRVPTGIATAIPAGYVGFVKPRSSVFFSGGDSDGTIDSDYRGEVMMQIRNVTRGNLRIEKGGRYAQMVVVPFLGDSVEVEELDITERGTGGFGSTGK